MAQWHTQARCPGVPPGRKEPSASEISGSASSTAQTSTTFSLPGLVSGPCPAPCRRAESARACLAAAARTSESGLAHNQGFCWHCWPSCLVDLTLAKPTDDIALYTKNTLLYCGASFLFWIACFVVWIACLIAQPTPVQSHARVINHAGRARPTLQRRVCHCTCGARAAYR